jgi:hypothetical protein
MPDAAALARLAWKYRELGDLRRARARGEAVPPPHVFKALAREFPGCLRELDTLALDEVDARARALAAAAEGGPTAPWMEWLGGYHALLRAALRIKPRAGAGLSDARAEALARDASAFAGVEVDAAFVRAVAAPPGGRVVGVVFARLSRLHGCPVAEMKAALFPARPR